jgi:DnaK suppressor protein
MSEFTQKFLDSQKKLLLTTKQKIIQNFQLFAEETKLDGEHVPKEEGDIAQKYQDQKLSISLRERDMHTLKEIDLALQKIEDGSYGLCEESGEPIEMKRLEKRPWARLSLYYAELQERESQRFFKRIG